MCLGIVGKVIKVSAADETAIIDVHGARREISIALLGQVKVGDYVLVHAGFAIEKIDLKEAEQMVKMWEEQLNDVTPGQVL
ncbi:hydrogenase assembly protein HypC [Moorella thermoacetica]|uniref:Hydrogenase assembly chaperone hypC/hupF n=1 Tax=Moorella thermoacetica (strain ATCC 39073 / JCM 9320) TaxID=264732 RepID=Q2RGH2_MOOTA|nr:HypC/HybG/HupF family hydrogenase formation chaperone [Moorella thermoacetica]AKX95020.1 hydrogenase isoenzymes formation protein HypC [Moorella thermoacetica]AKX97646.1 hydrogenase isoenzymes formation protein HypC [Moorella thermoacetica]OIQ53943.1 hydrogenase isoenzymes formation protein HypC [Moorella thermoacetica]OIQ59434.1 hydrogenase isoenzymes formation protein HypC [Moorella thermoacetica]QDA01468.1 Hydrogenase isoenzymes formation protein HypC [Moorella thermoacetica]